MLHIALYEPEIAPNAGNIARLCAATGSRLHLIGRLGFRLDEHSLRRAGVDYWEHVHLIRHADWPTFIENADPARLFAFSAHADQPYTSIAFQDGDFLLFGGESHGLPSDLLETLKNQRYAIPMPAVGVRSLNLATAVGIVTYEALRQIHHW